MRIVRARTASPLVATAMIALALATSPARAGSPTVPPGFKVRLVAAVPAVTFPCQLATGPGGALFVAEDPMDQVGPYEADHGRILLFRDGQEPVVFAEGFRAIFGMAWRDGSLYVMNMPRLTVLKDTDGDGKADSRKDIFTDLGPGPKALNDHIVSGLQFGMDGWLYISVGDKGVPGVHGPDGKTAQLRGGGVLRCRPDGTRIEVYSSGTRNHLEPNLDDRDNLFTYDNTDDGDGWWTRVSHHFDGAYFGYPFDYHDHADRFLPRLAEYGGGSPCGGVVYKDDAWPEAYGGMVLWSEWGKGHVAGVKFTPDGGTFKVASYDKFMDKAPGEDFRPIDLALSVDGTTLYVADWGMSGWGSKTEKVGRVYAVTYDGPKVDRAPRGKDSDDAAGQIKALGHPAHSERLRAQAALIRLGEPVLKAVEAALGNRSTSPIARRHLVWVVDGIATDRASGALAKAAADPVADVRAQALRAMGLRDIGGHAAKIAALGDADPTVRLQAAIALGRSRVGKDGGRIVVAGLIPGLVDRDPTVAFAARVALRRLADWGDAAPGLAIGADPKAHLALIAAMEGQYDPAAVKLLGSIVSEKTRPGDERAKALATLAEVHRKAKPWDGQWWGTRPSQGKPPEKSIDWDQTPAILAAVRSGLKDEATPVRLASVLAAWTTHDRPSLVTIRDRLAVEADESVRRAMARTLGLGADPASIPALMATLRDPKAPPSVREAAIGAVELIGGESAIKGLVGLLNAPGLEPAPRARLIASLGRAKAARETEGTVAAIAGSLADPDATVRAAAAEALGKIGDPKAAPAVRSALKDKVVEVRKAAIVAAGALKDREAIPDLIAAAGDDSTRFEASIALAEVPDLRALQVHLAALADRSPDLRKAAARSLGAIRDEAGPALDRLAARNELPSTALPELRKIFGATKPIVGWHLIGSFPMAAAPPFPLDATPDFSAPLSGVSLAEGKPAAWSKPPKIGPQGEVNLAPLFKDGVEKSVFGYAEVKVAAAGKGRIAVGSDDTLEVWVNGKSVYNFEGSRSMSLEAGTADVAFVAGVNRVVIRCGNHSGPWEFALSATTTSGDYAFLAGPSAGAFDPERLRADSGKLKGDAKHGQALFADAKGIGCIKCHVAGGQGGAVGPDLSGVGLKYPKDELVASVIYPSRRISSGYEPIVLATADGRTLTGILKSETGAAIEIEDADAKRVVVPKGDVEDRKTSDVSLMPNGLIDGLSPKDFADLIAYLESLKDTAGLHAPGGPGPK